ncbi:MAG TPA: glycosyltransferase family 4 protein [Leptolyngbyaceae cyanobacterium]
MFLITHPTGNANVRALLVGALLAGELGYFQTTVAAQTLDSWVRLIPQNFSKEFQRRGYDIPNSKISIRPLRELVRLLASKSNISFLTAHETGWASVDSVYRDLDRYVAKQLPRVWKKHQLSAVYCYEDGAFHTFKAAKQLGLKCFYDLPIAYWKTSQQLLREEAQRWPEWEPTLVGTRDSPAKLERKTEELDLADVVICPSKFVYDSLPTTTRQTKKCIVAEFGSPEIGLHTQKSRDLTRSPLRVLFAGSMTQRKGLADLFAAMKLLNRADVELVVLGTPLMPMEFYRHQLPNFTYEPTRPYQELLQLMQSCDVFILPSIVEGRALVQQEAMSCGLPLIVTANAGGEDLIEEGKTGFLVPIRSPHKIAEKIAYFADNRHQLNEMSTQARQKAAQMTWNNYSQKILNVVRASKAA